MKLSQTLAGNWVITVANTQEEGWETQLAEFSVENTGAGSPAREAIEAAAAAAFTAMVLTLTPRAVAITSHDKAEVYDMRQRCAEIGLQDHHFSTL